jgi:hypothetical protein
MFRPRTFFLAAAGLVLALLLACGGDKKDKEASSSGGSGAAASSASQTLDLSKSAEKLGDLKSFRFDLSMKLDLSSSMAGPSGSAGSGEDAFGTAVLGALLGGLGEIKAEGAYVAPDQTDIRLKFAGQEFGMVQSGQKSWVKFGDKWQADSAGGMGSFSFGNGSPADIFTDILPSEMLKGAKTSKETVNGVKATRYSFDKKALTSLTQELNQSGSFKELNDANLDVWLNDESVPVKIVMDVNGKDDKGQKVGMQLQVNFKDINGGFQIKAPI